MHTHMTRRICTKNLIVTPPVDRLWTIFSLWAYLRFLNFLQNHALVVERKKFLFWKKKGREGNRLVLGALVRTNASLPKFYSKGHCLRPSCQDPQGAPPAGFGCWESENAALPFRLDPIPERAHVCLLFINRHHVHVAPTFVPDDSCVHGCLTDARSLKAQEEQWSASRRVGSRVTPCWGSAIARRPA